MHVYVLGMIAYVLDMTAYVLGMIGYVLVQGMHSGVGSILLMFPIVWRKNKNDTDNESSRRINKVIIYKRIFRYSMFYIYIYNLFILFMNMLTYTYLLINLITNCSRTTLTSLLKDILVSWNNVLFVGWTK